MWRLRAGLVLEAHETEGRVEVETRWLSSPLYDNPYLSSAALHTLGNTTLILHTHFILLFEVVNISLILCVCVHV